MADPIGPQLAHDVKVRELTNDEREAVVIGLLEQCQNGWLKRDAITEMAHDLNVSRRCISRIWNKSVTARDNGNYSLSVVHNKKAGNTNSSKYDL